MKQVKLNNNDPDYKDLNPEIIELALTNGTVRQSIELYLSGSITWMQALETIVLAMGKEFRAQQKILIDIQMSNPSTTLYLVNGQQQLQLPAMQSRKP